MLSISSRLPVCLSVCLPTLLADIEAAIITVGQKAVFAVFVAWKDLAVRPLKSN